MRHCLGQVLSLPALVSVECGGSLVAAAHESCGECGGVVYVYILSL